MAPSSKPDLAIVGRIDYLQPRISKLAETYNVYQVPLETSRSEFYDLCKTGGKLDSVKALYYANFTSRALKADKEFVDALPESCISISNLGAGYDTVDVQAALGKNIQVSHTPNAVSAATATTAMYLILAALRRFTLGELHARRGLWDYEFEMAQDPEEKTLGIIGMGGIGQALARRALGFDMKVIYFNRNPLSEAVLKEAGLADKVTYCSSVEELVRAADVVSINVPLNESTKGFFTQRHFDLMKKNSVLVNTARGPVIDEPAMIRALAEGKIYSVGLDVFADEPNIPPELIKNENITILPHLGTSTRETLVKMENQVMDNCLQALEQGTVIHLVKEQKGHVFNSKK